MPSSIPPPSGYKFLLDENVRVELLDFLLTKKVTAARVATGTKDSQIAAQSKTERWIVVTNDSDFSHIPENKIFAVVWLRIRQNDLATLLASFEKLLAECEIFESKLIILHPTTWEDTDLSVVENQGK